MTADSPAPAPAQGTSVPSSGLPPYLTLSVPITDDMVEAYHARMVERGEVCECEDCEVQRALDDDADMSADMIHDYWD